MAQRIINENPHLTKTQMKVMQLVSRGKFNIEIAAIMGITNNTVRTHIQNILREFGVNNRTEASYMFNKLFGENLNEVR